MSLAQEVGLQRETISNQAFIASAGLVEQRVSGVVLKLSSDGKRFKGLGKALQMCSH